MDQNVIRNPELLLAESTALRALAARLMLDPGCADDLVQDTFVAALSAPPRSITSLRGWLGRVLQRFALRERRSMARRARRERVAARAEATESTAAIVQRVALQRTIVSALLDLAEPYRSTVVLRFFEDLTPSAIAAREHVPLGTVRSRLRRGLEMLRERLRREHGHDPLVACLPFMTAARSPCASSLAASAAKVLTMTTKLKIGVAGAALLLASSSAWWLLRDGEPGARSPSDGASAMLAPRQEPRSPPEPAIAPAREELAAPAAAPAPVTRALPPAIVAAPPAAPDRIRGHVLDSLGDVLPGVRVGHGDETAVSAGDGSFELGLESGWVEIVSVDPRYATVLAAHCDGSVSPALRQDYVVVVAPKVELAGVVLDQHEQPLRDASVRIRMPLSFRGRFRTVLDGSFSQEWTVRTGDDGRFQLVGAPAVEGAQIEAWRKGMGRGSVPVPACSDRTLRIVLAPGSTDGTERTTVAGLVLTRDGRAAADALVWLGDAGTRADAQGLFEVAVARTSKSRRRLVAMAEHALPAIFTPECDASGVEIWPEFVELRLGDAARSIAGRVLDTDGQPLRDAQVWITDPAFLGQSEDGSPVTIEHQLRGGADYFTCVRTGAQGEFVLDGLLDRAYTLRALHPSTAQSMQHGPIAAGERAVELRFPKGGLWDRVAGRVVDPHGSAVAGVQVLVVSTGCAVVSPAGSVWSNGGMRASVALTDAEGRFTLADVPRAEVTLSIEGDGILPTQHAIEDERHESLEIEVPRRCHVQFELRESAPDGAYFELLDARQHPLSFCILGGGSLWVLGRGEFTGMLSAAISAPDAAKWVVLYTRDRHELRRVAIELATDHLNSIKL
ncbi:MAG: sigma-70 family RNA polymerase sigma factor [Planctomycetota bacterium]